MYPGVPRCTRMYPVYPGVPECIRYRGIHSVAVRGRFGNGLLSWNPLRWSFAGPLRKWAAIVESTPLERCGAASEMGCYRGIHSVGAVRGRFENGLLSWTPLRWSSVRPLRSWAAIAESSPSEWGHIGCARVCPGVPRCPWVYPDVPGRTWGVTARGKRRDCWERLTRERQGEAELEDCAREFAHAA